MFQLGLWSVSAAYPLSVSCSKQTNDVPPVNWVKYSRNIAVVAQVGNYSCSKGRNTLSICVNIRKFFTAPRSLSLGGHEMNHEAL